MICDIIIPVYNRLDLTKKCLESICANTDSQFHLILIDNNSDLETRSYLEEFASKHQNSVLVRNEENTGWVKAVNQGMGLSKSPYLLLMNNDTAVRTDGWLLKLINVAEISPDIGLVNPHFQAKVEFFPDRPFIETDFCRGYCMLIKRSVADRIGLLDEAYGLGYYDDDDYSVRAIRAGFRCVRANDVFVEHVGDSTFSDILKDEKRRALHEANKQLFYSKWGKRLRLLFVLTRIPDRKAACDLFFALARKQHIVYLWNAAKPLRLEHINIREHRLSGLSCISLLADLLLNVFKKKTKRYNKIFMDTRDAGRVIRLVDSAAKR
jgi:GT2 family glycosyltransferase